MTNCILLPFIANKTFSFFLHFESKKLTLKTFYFRRRKVGAKKAEVFFRDLYSWWTWRSERSKATMMMMMPHGRLLSYDRQDTKSVAHLSNTNLSYRVYQRFWLFVTFYLFVSARDSNPRPWSKDLDRWSSTFTSWQGASLRI